MGPVPVLCLFTKVLLLLLTSHFCCRAWITRGRSGPVFAGCHPQQGQLRTDVCPSRPTRCHSFFPRAHQSLVSISETLFCQAQGLLPVPSLLCLLSQGRDQICSTSACSPFQGCVLRVLANVMPSPKQAELIKPSVVQCSHCALPSS